MHWKYVIQLHETFLRATDKSRHSNFNKVYLSHIIRTFIHYLITENVLYFRVKLHSLKFQGN